MSLKNLFKSSLSSLVYVTKKGKNCVFRDNKYATNDPEEIRELAAEAKSNPFIYVDPDDSTIDTSLQDRIAEAQRIATLEVIRQVEQEKIGIVQGSNTSQALDGVGTVIQSKEALNMVANQNQQPVLTPTGVSAVEGNREGMSAASLLKVTSTGSVNTLAALSNSK